MTELEQSTRSSVDVRTEYKALVAYHTALVLTRFTIAGFFIAAVGFAGNRLFQSTTPVGGKIALALLAALITFSVWILELRTRSLYTTLAVRGTQIEHFVWKIQGASWYDPFWSRQHKLEPRPELSKAKHPGPDLVKIAWLRKPCGPSVSKLVSHSMGFDLLYPGALLFWLGAACYYSFLYLSTQALEGRTMDPVSALLAFGIAFLGYRAVTAAPKLKDSSLSWKVVLALLGLVLILGAAVVVYLGFRMAGQRCAA